MEPVSDPKFVKILLSFGFINHDSEVEEAMEQLREYHEDMKKTLACTGWSYYTHSWQKANTISEAMDAFYDNLNERNDEMEDSARREELRIGFDPLFEAVVAGEKDELLESMKPAPWSSIKEAYLAMIVRHNRDVRLGRATSSRQSQRLDEARVRDRTLSGESKADQASSRPGSRGKSRGRDNEGLRAVSESQMFDEDQDGNNSGEGNEEENESKLAIQREATVEFEDTDHTERPPSNSNAIDGIFRAKMTRTSTWGTKKEPVIDERTRFVYIMRHPEASLAGKAAKAVEMMEEILNRGFLLCRHVALLINVWNNGRLLRTKTFGSYRVDLIVKVFHIIKDIWNFELIIKGLSAEETAAVYCRLGMLNLWNPMKPDGAWELNLGRYEERVIAKMVSTKFLQMRPLFLSFLRFACQC
jgi:hypothetical protein